VPPGATATPATPCSGAALCQHVSVLARPSPGWTGMAGRAWLTWRPGNCPAGYYGTSDSESFSEGSRSGGDYLAEVCREWEAVAESAQVGLGFRGDRPASRVGWPAVACRRPGLRQGREAAALCRLLQHCILG
jgi:hypothetical protein